MASLEIGLLQANAHGQDLAVGHLGPLSPLLLPVRQVTLVKAVRGRDFTLCPGSCIVVGDGTGQTTDDEAAGQGCHERIEQHDA